MKKGFDNTVGWYDTLATLVFGQTIRKAQIYFLHCIPEDAHVLILGGGTGWIIEEFFKIKPNCQLTYVEASEKMLERSRQRALAFHSSLTFIHGTQEDLPVDAAFDVILTPFVLDMYTDDSLKEMMSRLKKALKQGGQWIVTDFRDQQKGWQKWLLKAMYVFFGYISKIEARKSPDYHYAFETAGLEVQQSAEFFGKMIFTKVLKER